MTIKPKFFVFLMLIASLSYAEEFHFGSEIDSSWAETPYGKFECFNGDATHYRQVLKFNGRIIYSQPDGKEIGWQNTLLKQGINIDMGCPDIVASRDGYVVIARSVQPPHYLLNDYAVINFNAHPATFIELVEAQGPQDEKIPERNRFVWDKTGFTLTYFGYRIGAAGGSSSSPKPKRLKVRFDFADGAVTQVK